MDGNAVPLLGEEDRPEVSLKTGERLLCRVLPCSTNPPSVSIAFQSDVDIRPRPPRNGQRTIDLHAPPDRRYLDEALA